MRYLIVSDIHSNLEAFEAVIEASMAERVDRRLFLGDIVGYGPDPDACLERLLHWTDFSLMGNHDYAVLGLTPIAGFNPVAQESILWTISHMRLTSKLRASQFPCTAYYDGMCLAHSSPYQPEEWHYIFTTSQARLNFQHVTGRLCFVGHSHIPMVMEQKSTGEVALYNQPVCALSPHSRYIINVGSVGQPRDNDSQSCYVIYDSDKHTLEYRRVPYPIFTTQEKILQAGLPEFLAYRLGVGY